MANNLEYYTIIISFEILSNEAYMYVQMRINQD